MIRLAKQKDINKILELLVQVNMVHHNLRPDIFKGPATKYSNNELEKIIANSNTPIFVNVDENDEVLGYIFCINKQFKNDSILTDIKTLYIDDLCIDEKKRNHHLGKELLDYIMNYAKENDYDNVTLNVWSCNEQAFSFYQKYGFDIQKIGMEMKIKK